MAIAVILVLLGLFIEMEYSPRIDQTKEGHIYLWYWDFPKRKSMRIW